MYLLHLNTLLDWHCMCYKRLRPFKMLKLYIVRPLCIGKPITWDRHSPTLGVNELISLKLFGHEIIFEEFQPIWSRNLIVTDKGTDMQSHKRTQHSKSAEITLRCGNLHSPVGNHSATICRLSIFIIREKIMVDFELEIHQQIWKCIVFIIIRLVVVLSVRCGDNVWR